MLTITEELMLLAVHDDKGHFILSAASALPYGIAASVILELQHRQIIEIDSNGLVKLIKFEKTDIDFLDFTVEHIKTVSKVKDCEFWIRSLALDYKVLKEKIIDNLVLKGILKRKAKKFFFMIDFKKYPTLNPAPELETRDRIHKVVLMGLEPDERVKDLIILLFHCSLLDEVFPKNLRNIATKFIKNLAASSKLGKLIKDISEEMSLNVIIS